MVFQFEKIHEVFSIWLDYTLRSYLKKIIKDTKRFVIAVLFIIREKSNLTT